MMPLVARGEGDAEGDGKRGSVAGLSGDGFDTPARCGGSSSASTATSSPVAACGMKRCADVAGIPSSSVDRAACALVSAITLPGSER